MKIAHKLEYIVMLVVSLLLVFAVQHTIVTYGIEGKVPYTNQWRSSGTGYSSDELQMIEDLKTSIREKGEYFFYVGEDKELEFASIESRLEDHALGYKIANAGPVTYIEVADLSVLKIMVSSESDKNQDVVHFSIENYDGQVIYNYSGVNESFQEEIVIEPGVYFISTGVKANDSQFNLSLKYSLELK